MTNNNSRGEITAMRPAKRITRSFSLDLDVVSDVERTKGSLSASEHVNRLLKRALETERQASLSEEAAQFFGDVSADRDERRVFQQASLKTVWRNA
jgi:hypothetical protein